MNHFKILKNIAVTRIKGEIALGGAPSDIISWPIYDILCFFIFASNIRINEFSVKLILATFFLHASQSKGSLFISIHLRFFLILPIVD